MHEYYLQGIRNNQLSRNYRYDEELVVPIIENTPWEEDLTESLDAAIQQYPQTTAVLVRRHGVYVWGDSWQSAKSQ
jgi:methylthioribulose-1-phosphate dehydratase